MSLLDILALTEPSERGYALDFPGCLDGGIILCLGGATHAFGLAVLAGNPVDAAITVA